MFQSSSFPVSTSTIAVDDAQILARVREALQASCYAQIQRLDVYCENGRITVQGQLPTSFLKQSAQAVIQSIADVRDIDNDVIVYSP